MAAWALDKQLNNQITDDLAVYFISHFIIKGISKYALRFLVANLNLNNKNPAKSTRDACTEKWNSLPQEGKNARLYQIDNPPPYDKDQLPFSRMPLPAMLPWPPLPFDKENKYFILFIFFVIILFKVY
jgi:hypothetical protein